jgi:hypothetical protein
MTQDVGRPGYFGIGGRNRSKQATANGEDWREQQASENGEVMRQIYRANEKHKHY